MAVRFSILDVASAAVFWGMVGAAGTAVAARFRGSVLRARPMFAWTLVAAGWAFAEAVFKAVVVLKPTRWPPLIYSAIGIGVPMILAGLVALTALRRAAREQRVRSVHPALVIVACWATLSVLLLFLPRWLQGFADAPAIGWVLWGALDLIWILMGAALAVIAGAAVLLADRRRMVIASAAVLVLAGLQLAPLALRDRDSQRSAQSATPSIVWIMMDGVRADHVSAYGYKRATTPGFDRLAANGSLIHGHISAGVRTENTYSKMLALLPTLDGYARPSPVPLSAIRELLPESVRAQPGVIAELQKRGYQTALFHVYHDLLEEKGLQPWLESFDTTFRTRLTGDASLGSYVVRMLVGDRVDGMPRMDRWAAYRRRFLAEHVTTEVEEFLGTREASQPLFLIVHLAGVHKPYYRFGTAPAVPDPPNARVRDYDNALRSADEQLAGLVELVRKTLTNPTIFVFADHGEVMKEEPMLPQYMTVPLLVMPALPAAPATLTTSQDIVATSLAIAATERPRCEGRLARDLRCPNIADEVRVVDHTGHGKLMLAASLGNSLAAVEIKKQESTIGSLGPPLSICEFLKRADITASKFVVGPLDHREKFPARLQRQLDKCQSQ